MVLNVMCYFFLRHGVYKFLWHIANCWVKLPWIFTADIILCPRRKCLAGVYRRKLLHSSYKAVHHVRTYKDLQSAQCQLVAEPVRTSMYLKLTPILKSPTRQLCPLWFWCTIDISYQHLFFLLFNKVWYVQNGSRNLQQKKTRKPSYRWQTRATRKCAKNCSNSTCLQRCRWQYWPIFMRLAAVASKICEIPRNSLKIQSYEVQGHPRSSILVPIDSPYVTCY